MRTNNLSLFGVCLAVLAIPPLLPGCLASVGVDALAWVAAVVLVGGIFGTCAPRAAHLYMLISVLVWLCFGVGFAEVGAVVLWLASAWSMGVLLLRGLSNAQDSEIRFTEAVLLGAAIWLAIWGGMLHFAVNYRALYIVLCLLPCLVLASKASSIRSNLHARVHAAQNWMRSIPLWAWVAGLAVVGWVLRWASFPTMSYDDHALHLRLWTELLTQQRCSFDVHAQIWSVAPFAADLLYAGLSLMAGDDARGAVNLGLAILLFCLMARIFQNCKLPERTSWLLIVLMASTPMLGNQLLTLQTELLLAVLALAGVRLVLDAEGGWHGQSVLGVLACAALCAAIKLPGAVLGATLLAALMLRWWGLHAIPVHPRYRLRWPALFILFPLGFVALHSYVLAWMVTGNPVFPLYNAIFLSPYYWPVNFSDAHWSQGFSLWSYVRAFFHTSEFFEGGDGTAGWQYLIMLPVAMLALLRSGVPNGLRITLVPVLGFGLAMFSAIQYWRYLFPVMPLAGIILAALFVGKIRVVQRVALVLALVCIALNLFYFPKVVWVMGAPAGLAFTPKGEDDLIGQYAPQVMLTNRINRLAPGSRVLYPARAPSGATLHGSPLYVNWYAQSRLDKFSSLKDFQGIAKFLSRESVDFVILSMGDVEASGTPEALLREYLARFGSVLAQEGSFLLYRTSETPALYRNVFDLRASETKRTGSVDLLLPLSDAGGSASAEPKALAIFPAYRSKQARYRAEFSCSSDGGFFIAQINWDKGAPYYRLVACRKQGVSFVEAIPVPMGASQGTVYVTVRDTLSAKIDNISIDVN
jgi:hypothetical protein